MKIRLQSKTDTEKTSAKLRRFQSGRLSSTAMAGAQFANLHNLSLARINKNSALDTDDVPKNDWAPMAAVLDFLPTAALCASAVSITTLIVLSLLSCNRGISIAIATTNGALTLFGLSSYKSAQARAQGDEMRRQADDRNVEIRCVQASL